MQVSVGILGAIVSAFSFGLIGDASATIVSYTYTGTLGSDLYQAYKPIPNTAGSAFKIVLQSDSTVAGSDDFRIKQFTAAGQDVARLDYDVFASVGIDTTHVVGFGFRTLSLAGGLFTGGPTDLHIFNDLGLYVWSPVMSADFTKPIVLTSSNATFAYPGMTSYFRWGISDPHTGFLANDFTYLNVTRLEIMNSDYPPQVPPAVPLPPAAPMFGAALIVLGGIRFGLKRKRATAA